MKKRYACISVIDDDSLSEVKKLQDEIYELTGSKRYKMEWPNHITLGVGNELTDSEFANISKKLENISKNTEPFYVEIKDILFKENPNLKKLNDQYTPHVVHLGVAVNKKLENLVGKIDNVLRDYPVFFEIFPYHPHMTIAGRDLTKEGFEKLKDKIGKKDFSTKVKISGYSLVLAPGKENNLNRMKVVKEYKLD